MARKKPAKKAKKKSAARPAARKPAKKTSKKAKPKAVRKVPTSARATAGRPKKAAPNRRAAGIRAAASKKAAKTIKKAKQTAAAIKAVGTKKAAAAKSKGRFLTAVKKLATAAVAAGVGAAFPPASAKGLADKPAKKPNLDRPRKTVADVHGIPSSLDMDRSASSAKSGRAEMRDKLSKSNSGGAAITAGDVDADWLSAETVGDEAPGGDNPTPDQDRVDDIGRALGVEYADDEELQGGAEIADRDLNRWELDPASKEDFDDDET